MLVGQRRNGAKHIHDDIEVRGHDQQHHDARIINDHGQLGRRQADDIWKRDATGPLGSPVICFGNTPFRTSEINGNRIITNPPGTGLLGMTRCLGGAQNKCTGQYSSIQRRHLHLHHLQSRSTKQA